MHKRKSAFLRVIKSTLHYIMRPTTLHKTSCIYWLHSFLKTTRFHPRHFNTGNTCIW